MSSSERLCLAMSLSAVSEDDLADLGLVPGVGGGMLLLSGVWKPVWKWKPEFVGSCCSCCWTLAGMTSSSMPSNWGMPDIMESAAREADLVDLGRDPGVVGVICLCLVGVCNGPEGRAQ